jgi:protein-tyrosine phosphatase
MEQFEIFQLSAGRGLLALSQMPGRTGNLTADVAAIESWGADLVISMTPVDELREKGADDLPSLLEAKCIKWLSLPIVDFGAPDDEMTLVWDAIAPFVRQILTSGGRVLVHCHGGCGRSGMAVLKILTSFDEDPQTALARIRAVRPCAIETDEQLVWAQS